MFYSILTSILQAFHAVSNWFFNFLDKSGSFVFYVGTFFLVMALRFLVIPALSKGSSDGAKKNSGSSSGSSSNGGD